jgi:hypothetical protein
VHLARIRYRVGQFVSGWRAAVSPEDDALAEQVLAPIGMGALGLFRRMPHDAQAHSLRVLKALQAEGPVTPDLAAAALLHDAGKVAADEAGAYLGLWLRGPLVILEAWQPHLLARWADPQPRRSLRYALYVHGAHPEIGAAWAEAAGCSPLTCWLIARHQDKQAAAPTIDSTTARQCLIRLQRADSRN